MFKPNFAHDFRVAPGIVYEPTTMILGGIALAGAATSAVGTMKSMKAAEKQAEAQDRIQKLQHAEAKEKKKRESRERARQLAIARAEAASNVANAGVDMTSSGGIGAQQSLDQSNRVAFGDMQKDMQHMFTMSNAKTALNQTQADMAFGGALQGLGSTITSQATNVASIFNSAPGLFAGGSGAPKA